MILLNPKFIVDSKGRKQAVVLPIKEFEFAIEELENFDDVMSYDKTKSKNEKSISFAMYLKKRNKK